MLRNFLAVMKDSFREAVDGFIIYVMLGLAVIAIVFAASVSFYPDDADSGFKSIVQQFSQVFQSQGTANEEVAVRIPVPVVGMIRQPLQVAYTATDVTKLDGGSGYAGKYSLRVTATDTSNGLSIPGLGLLTASKNFPTVVAAWAQATPTERYLLFPASKPDSPTGLSDAVTVPDGTDPQAALAAQQQSKGGRWVVVSFPTIPPAEVAAVTDEQMAAFVKNQFLIHSDLSDVIVARRATKPGVYEFDVTATVPSGSKGWPHKTYYLFGAFGGDRSGPLGPAVYLIQDLLVNTLGASITLLVSVILTGFFIPNMLRKGSLDLLVAKPMSRWELLLYKYLGGLTFVLLVMLVTVGGVWLALAVRSGNWNPAFLLSALFVTFIFAVLYAVSTLVAVLTRSAIAAILITCLFMVGVWGVGVAKSIADVQRSNAFTEAEKKTTFGTIIDAVDATLPRYNDVMKLNSELLTESYCTQSLVKAGRRTVSPSWGVAVGISLAYIAALLGLAYWRFATRDP